MLNDATLVWGGDLTPGPTGDIALATGSILGQQKVLRRLLTNVNDYVWHPQYGAGLGQFVGTAVDVRLIASVIKNQIFSEAAVARQPEPTIEAAVYPTGSVCVTINYVDALNGDGQELTFSVGV